MDVFWKMFQYDMFLLWTVSTQPHLSCMGFHMFACLFGSCFWWLLGCISWLEYNMSHDTDKKLNVDIVIGYQWIPLPSPKINLSSKKGTISKGHFIFQPLIFRWYSLVFRGICIFSAHLGQQKSQTFLYGSGRWSRNADNVHVSFVG